MQSPLEQSNYLSPVYYKMPLITQFVYRTGTFVSIEPKRDLTKFLKVRPILRSVENSIICRTQEDIRLSENLYTFENSTDIGRFLLTHQHLIEILFEADRQIKKVFREEINLFLELHHDPEEDFEGLFIIIKTNLSPDESLDLLDRFEEEWWLDIDFKVRSIMGVMVRPI